MLDNITNKSVKSRPLGFKFVAVKQINEKQRGACDKFRALTILNKAEYDSILPVFLIF